MCLFVQDSIKSDLKKSFFEYVNAACSQTTAIGGGQNCRRAIVTGHRANNTRLTNAIKGGATILKRANTF